MVSKVYSKVTQSRTTRVSKFIKLPERNGEAIYYKYLSQGHKAQEQKPQHESDTSTMLYTPYGGIYP